MAFSPTNISHKRISRNSFIPKKNPDSFLNQGDLTRFWKTHRSNNIAPTEKTQYPQRKKTPIGRDRGNDSDSVNRYGITKREDK